MGRAGRGKAKENRRAKALTSFLFFPMEPKLYTTAEAAPIIEARFSRPMNEWKVRRLCRLNRIPGAFQRFSRWYIPEDALNAYLNK